ncbi:MAG TPA: tRNA (guanosine(37)-N1)-methyltransferase TrmD [Actinobacteria bacterium]|nr:tRNA (guanosine(37)-N1)-methyltransferase TrmD [Actinomycetota bacterium]
MIIDIITIFPQVFENIVEYGVIKEAFKNGSCVLNIYDLRDFTDDRHRKVDDRPYGGGPGMVLMAGPLDRAISHIREKNAIRDRDLQKTILMAPGGERLQQACFKKLTVLENLILICGRYEGVDQRFIELSVDMEISIGDYVLTGGEIPAMVLMDGIIRLMPGVVGKEESLQLESFENGLLDWPQYTRPSSYKGLKVPLVLQSGNHGDIQKWRKERAFEITKKRRPDLFDKRT